MAQSDSHIARRSRSLDDAPTVIDEDLYEPEPPRAAGDQDASTDLQVPEGKGAANPARKPKDLENQKTIITRSPPVSPSAAPAWTGSSTSAELGALLEGKRLGHFVLEEFVGGGGMGAVFRGRDELLGRVVAVKVLSRDQGADPETLRRFKNEAQSAARLDHENIARVFFVGEDDGWHFIVFEFIDGINLRELVERDGPLSLEVALDYTIQVAEALEHAAEREVVHRDIKPSNVLVANDGFVKLVDMGLARLHQMEAGHSDLTASGVTLGTFDYISPEQASDPRRADVRSDIYSLGCTLFYVLTARPPFPHGTVLQKLLAHSGEAPPDARELRPDIPDELQKILSRMLAKRPEQRYARPADLIGELLTLRDRLGLASLAAASRGHVPPERLTWRQRAMAWAIPLALMLMLVVGWELFLSGGYTTANNPPEFRIPVQEGAAAVSRDVAGDNTQNGTTSSSAAGDDSAELTPAIGDGATMPDAASPASSNAAGASNNEPTSPPPSAEATPTEVSSGSSTTTVDPPLSPVPVDPVSSPDSTPAVDDPAPASPAPIATEAVRVLVVGDASQLGDLGPHVRIFATLGAALASEEFQDAKSTIKLIEVRSSRTAETWPLRVALPAGRELTIRGASAAGDDGPLSIIAFDAALGGPPTGDHGMIEVASGKLTVENLHLQLTTGETAAGDLALLRLSAGAVKDVDLKSCILTIENDLTDDQGRVAFIDIVAPAESMERPTKLPIDLEDCIVRGGADMVRMRQSLPIILKWNNGLLATSQRLLVADGSPQSWDDTIGLSLSHVTVSVGQGLCLLRDSIDQPHQPALEFVCNKSIISAGSSALVEHDGVGDVEKFRHALVISGGTNYFEGVTDYWRVYVDNIQQEELKWDWATWKEKLAMGGKMLSKMMEIRWQRDRTDVPTYAPHRCGLDDFLPDPESDNPIMQVMDDGDLPSGLKPDELPALYRIAPPAAAEAASNVEAGGPPAFQ